MNWRTGGADFGQHDPPLSAGVPLLMPGEMITEESRAVLDFLLMLCSIGRHYPGFETDIHGAKRDEDGVYRVRVLKMTKGLRVNGAHE